jgi:hypothetical protein
MQLKYNWLQKTARRREGSLVGSSHLLFMLRERADNDLGQILLKGDNVSLIQSLD